MLFFLPVYKSMLGTFYTFTESSVSFGIVLKVLVYVELKWDVELCNMVSESLT